MDTGHTGGASNMANDVISRQAAIDALDCISGVEEVLRSLPSAQQGIAEKLSMYKCYITDSNGLQHEVIHIGDIRMVTGWMI